MEGKAALFKRFGDIDAWPLCLDTQDVDEIITVVKAVAPGFAGINLEDIPAPRCFEIERRLREQLDIPVFHDDQHGTAIVVLAALLNALREWWVNSSATSRSSSPAATASNCCWQPVPETWWWLTSPGSCIGAATGSRDSCCGWPSTPTGWTGTLKEAVVGADVFIGVSAPG